MRQAKALISGAHHILHEAKKYRSVCTQFFAFACGMLFVRCITLLCTPLTMCMLSPEDYGLLALANSFISILTACFGLGLRQALSFYYFQYTEPSRHRLLRTICFTYLLCAGTMTMLILCNIHRCNCYFFLNTASLSLLLLCISIASLYFFVELAYQLLQYRQETKKITYMQIVVACIHVGCSLFFLYSMHLGPISILLGQAVGMLCILIIERKVYHRLITQPADAAYTCVPMRTYITQSLPFVPSMLCGVLLASGDRWALAHISTLHNVGIYSLANTLAQCAHTIILYAMTGSYMPYMLKRFAAQPASVSLIEKENKRIMWFCMSAYFILLCVGFGCIKPAAHWVIPKKFHEAIDYMGILLIGSIFYVGTHFLNCIIHYNKKSIFLGFALLVPSLLNIGLNLLLIPICSIYGCVIATLIAYIAYFCITFAYNSRLCRITQ